jgi:heat shock protein HslJ
VGTAWQWERFIGNNDSQIEVDDPTRYTLTLQADGLYQVEADCNLASGRYTLEGAALSLLPGPTTLAECGPDSLYDSFLKNLGHVRIYTITDEGKLVLDLWADGGHMVFGPSPDL